MPAAEAKLQSALDATDESVLDHDPASVLSGGGRMIGMLESGDEGGGFFSKLKGPLGG